jgi:hypothetical protein
MMRLLKHALLILLSFCIAGCYNMRVVAEGRDAVQLATTGKADGLRVGDRLLITTSNGEQIKIRVKALEPDAILGDIDGQVQPVRVPHEQMARIERKEFSGKRTWLLLGNLIGLVVVSTILALGNAICVKGRCS